jgi:hypothetical protein
MPKKPIPPGSTGVDLKILPPSATLGPGPIYDELMKLYLWGSALQERVMILSRPRPTVVAPRGALDGNGTPDNPLLVRPDGNTIIINGENKLQTIFSSGSGGVPLHATTHEAGGTDEINVTGLNGLLADPQTPTAHASSHYDGGSDELDILQLGGYSGSTTNFLRADGSFAAPTASSGAMTFVGSSIIAGSAASVLTISSLDLTTDQLYFITWSLKNATASQTVVSLYFSADTTATNYYRQNCTFDNTTVSASRANDGAFIVMAASGVNCGDALIHQDFNGRPRTRYEGFRENVSDMTLYIVNHVRNNTGNVTSITLSSSIANALDIGSIIKVFKISS